MTIYDVQPDAAACEAKSLLVHARLQSCSQQWDEEHFGHQIVLCFTFSSQPSLNITLWSTKLRYSLHYTIIAPSRCIGYCNAQNSVVSFKVLVHYPSMNYLLETTSVPLSGNGRVERRQQWNQGDLTNSFQHYFLWYIYFPSKSLVAFDLWGRIIS